MPASLQDRRTRARAGAALVLAGFGIFGLTACGSSGASGTTPATTVPVATMVPPTDASMATAAPVATDLPTTTVAGTVTVTEADVADLEKQLDEIDQLLNGVDADLARD